jgi:hypothetical protein
MAGRKMSISLPARQAGLADLYQPATGVHTGARAGDFGQAAGLFADHNPIYLLRKKPSRAGWRRLMSHNLLANWPAADGPNMSTSLAHLHGNVEHCLIWPGTRSS